MKKRITLLFAMLAALVTTAMADNVISVDQTAISQSGTAKLTINLANTGVVRGLQFTLTLPDGVTAKPSTEGIEYGNANETYAPENGVLVSTTTRTDNWWVLGNKVSDNVYKFVLIDPNGGGLDAGNGAIMTISFETTLTEPFTVDITGIHMAIAGSDDSSEDATQGDIENANVTVTDIIKGDVNNDGDIFTDDAVCILRYVVGKTNAVFIEGAADVNDDNEIDTQDAVLILKYVVGKITSFSRGESEGEIDWDDVIDPD